MKHGDRICFNRLASKQLPFHEPARERPCRSKIQRSADDVIEFSGVHSKNSIRATMNGSSRRHASIGRPEAPRSHASHLDSGGYRLSDSATRVVRCDRPPQQRRLSANSPELTLMRRAPPTARVLTPSERVAYVLESIRNGCLSIASKRRTDVWH